MKKLYSRIISVVSITLMLLAMPICVSADSPYKSFTYDLENNAIAAPQSAEFCYNITGSKLGIGSFTEPTDVFADKSGALYIADKANNRIVKTDKFGNLIYSFNSFINNGTKETFSNPEGLTVTSDGNIYICDTGNSRVVELNSSLELVRIILSPQSSALGSSFIFSPVRIAVDSLNRIYVVSKNFNSGIIELTKKGEFNQIFGPVKVEYNAIDIIWRMFSTKAQRNRSQSIVPNEYSSVCADEKDFIYACSAYHDSTNASSGSVKKLNSLGNNILKEVPDESINRYAKGTYSGSETYVDICSMSNHIYALADNTRGRIFAYNDDGDLLFEFGAKGEFKGTFGTISALEYHDGYFYIADSRNDVISVFKTTEYANMFLKASEYHQQGDYDSENAVWKDIYSLNNNSICTIRNFGRVKYREGNYSEAMKYFKLANDNESYSKAYTAQRKIFINEYFNFIFIGIMGAVILVAVLLIIKAGRPKKKRDPFTYISTLKYSTKVIFRPISGFWDMKKEHYGSTGAAMTILCTTTLFYAIFNCTKGFIFTSGVTSANFFLSLFTVLAPFFLFVICNWCVSNLMNGEGSFKYIFMGTAYSLTPLMMVLPLLLILSHVMTNEEKGVYTLIIAIIAFWSILLLICSNMEIHAYTMSHTILVLVITIVVMVIVVFLIMLVFALVQEVIGVAGDMINEIYLRF